MVSTCAGRHRPIITRAVGAPEHILMIAVAADDFARSGQISVGPRDGGSDRVLVAAEGVVETLLGWRTARHGNLRPGDSLVVCSGIALNASCARTSSSCSSRSSRRDLRGYWRPGRPDFRWRDSIEISQPTIPSCTVSLAYAAQESSCYAASRLR